MTNPLSKFIEESGRKFDEAFARMEKENLTEFYHVDKQELKDLNASSQRSLLEKVIEETGKKVWDRKCVRFGCELQF